MDISVTAVKTGRRRYLTLIMIFITVVICYVDRANLAVASAHIQEEFGISKAEMGYVFSAFAWLYTLCQIPGGWFLDRVGSRLTYFIAIFGWSVATLLQGFATGLMSLIGLRAITGIFEAPAFPTNNRMVTSWFPEHERASAVGFYTSGQFVGLAFLTPLLLDASYWHIDGIEITDKSLRVQGSHNLIENVTAYRNDDTGIQISSPADVGRPLWASFNRVVNSESFSNEDPGKINADGFAVKMRVGEGNRLEGCYSHDNIDDGFDLFNKIEDGANGVVVIENSIARNNTSNGFKLGGEGQPVAHEVRNSIAIDNHLDGFTDNFNPGKLVVVNNVAVDNQRFNYLFRPSPYGAPETQGTFSENLSLRSQPGKYDDAVVGNIDDSNYFIHGGRSINAQGKRINSADYQTLALPDPLTREADGSFNTGNFLSRN